MIPMSVYNDDFSHSCSLSLPISLNVQIKRELLFIDNNPSEERLFPL